MSDALPMLSGNMLSQEMGQMAGVQARQAGNSGESSFPALFDSMSYEGDAVNTAIIPPQLIPVANTETAFLQPVQLVLPVNTLDAGNMPVSVNLPEQISEDGNLLPVDMPEIAWSGMFAVSDDDGATALAMQGDAKQGYVTKPVYAQDLSSALQKLQMQVSDAGSDPVTGLTKEQQLNALFQSQQSTPQLNSAGQALLSDNLLQQPQTNNSQATFNHQAVNLDLGSLGVANRGSDSQVAQINLPVNQPQWGQQVSERVHWMVSHNLQQADIRLNPPELGSLEVRIQVQGDQTNVSFTSPHAQVRDALDAALPRLREMLEESGLSLGDVNVSQQSVAQGQSESDRDGYGTNRSNQAVEDEQSGEADSAKNHTIKNGINMLDVYA